MNQRFLKPLFLSFVTLLLLISGCDSPSSNQVDGSETQFSNLKRSFDAETFAEIMPYNFKVDWTSGKKGFSEKLEATYYEFPVSWTNKPDTQGMTSNPSQSNIEYKILAIKDGNIPQFYVLKFKGTPDSSTENILWSDLKDFTGHIYVIDKEDQKVLAHKYSSGKYEGDVTFISKEEYENSQNRKPRLYEVCHHERTDYYANWYRIYEDGSTELTSTTYLGSTYSETCHLVNSGSTGGGGSSGGGTTVYTEYEDRYLTDEHLSVNPLVKYPKDSNYHEDYPKLTEYLRNKLPNIASNDRIVDAILKYTDLTREQIKEELQWGDGPIIEIVEVTNICNSCDDNTAGYYNSKKNPDILYLDIDAVNLLENSPNQVLGDAFSFWIGTTVLHEFVHYGDAKDGSDYPREEGLLFEDEAYGQNVTNENATDILFNR